MRVEIFNNLIKKNNGDYEDNTEEQEKNEREELLSLLPEELREKSVREKYSLEHIKMIVEFREKKDYKVVTGFHVSPVDLPIGGEIRPGQDGDICFSTSIKSLYLGKGGSGYIYAMECSEKLMKPLDVGLSWYTLKAQGGFKIIDKIKMTPENVKLLGAGFADCDYS